MNSKLSTHVLDTYHGKPAAGMKWALLRQSFDGIWMQIKNGQTNVDGRTDELLLDDLSFLSGTYQIQFEAGQYFKSLAVTLPDPPFLNRIVIEFNITAGNAYHVPLLLTPWSYSTYRGS